MTADNKKLEEAIKGMKVLRKDFSGYKPNEEMFDMAIEALEKLKTGEWNVITKRPMDAEEREFWEVEMGEISDEDAYIYENLPEEGEEVLVCTLFGRVFIDTMCRDEGCYFEEYGDLEDVVAWMPLPEPYKEVCE